jgi:hypothetical protein
MSIFQLGRHVGIPCYRPVDVDRQVENTCGHIASQGVSGGVISYFVRSDALIELLTRVGESIPDESNGQSPNPEP